MKKERKQKNIAPQKAISEGKDNRLPLLFAALAIAVITYITYTPSLSGSFTNWDDDTYVTANPVIQSPSIDWKAIFTQPVALNYHPVTMLTLVLNYKVAGNEPKAYHATNLLLHIMNSILLFLFFYFLSGRKIVTGALAGLLSGIHPMHVESVAWISERKDVLYVFFLLLSLLAYVRYRSGHKTVWLICCFLLFLLSCLSKAMAVVLPLLLILIDYFQQRKLTRLAWLEKIPFLMASLVFGIIALRIQAGSANEAVAAYSLLQRFFFGCYGCLFYIVKFIVPFSLSAFYPYPDTTDLLSLPLLFYVAPVALAAGCWLIFRYLRKQSFIIFGCGFFLTAIVLVLQFISVGNALMADRYSYLSYGGFCFIAGYGFEKFYRERPSMRTTISLLAGMLLLIFGWLTHERTKVWTNSETLWSDVISKYPTAATAYKNRGNYYGERGNTAAAMKDYGILLNMKTTDPEVYNNLGNIYAGQNKVAESIAAYSKAIALKPDYVNAYINRGISYNSLQQPEKAIEDFSKAIAFNTQKATLWAQRGYTYFTIGRFNDAIHDFNSALQLQPDFDAAIYCRGLSYYKTGNKAEAIKDLMKAKSMGYQGDYSLLIPE